MRSKISLTEETIELFAKTGRSFAFFAGESGVVVDAENPSTIASLPVEVISYMLDIKDDEGNKMFTIEELEDVEKEACEKESTSC